MTNAHEVFRWLREWIPVVSGLVGALSLAVAAGTFFGNGYVERGRWRAHLAVQPVSKDVSIVLNETLRMHESVTAVVTGLNGEVGTAPPPPVAPELPEPPPRPLHFSDPQSTDTLHLLVRNSSFRPAAIVKAFLRDPAGKEVQIDEREYAKRFGMPMPISPWQISTLVLVFNGDDYRKAARLVLLDMDDGELEIPLGDVRWRKWYGFPTR